ncbi:hypothetical protein GF322_05110, partial [Candidatus Dependentiae bacterium]|nr:hypothetical protein [Candidatus Dependentiae bacterium]
MSTKKLLLLLYNITICCFLIIGSSNPGGEEEAAKSAVTQLTPEQIQTLTTGSKKQSLDLFKSLIKTKLPAGLNYNQFIQKLRIEHAKQSAPPSEETQKKIEEFKKSQEETQKKLEEIKQQAKKTKQLLTEEKQKRTKAEARIQKLNKELGGASKETSDIKEKLDELIIKLTSVVKDIKNKLTGQNFGLSEESANDLTNLLMYIKAIEDSIDKLKNLLTKLKAELNKVALNDIKQNLNKDLLKDIEQLASFQGQDVGVLIGKTADPIINDAEYINALKDTPEFNQSNFTHPLLFVTRKLIPENLEQEISFKKQLQQAPNPIELIQKKINEYTKEPIPGLLLFQLIQNLLSLKENEEAKNALADLLDNYIKNPTDKNYNNIIQIEIDPKDKDKFVIHDEFFNSIIDPIDNKSKLTNIINTMIEKLLEAFQKVSTEVDYKTNITVLLRMLKNITNNKSISLSDDQKYKIILNASQTTKTNLNPFIKKEFPYLNLLPKLKCEYSTQTIVDFLEMFNSHLFINVTEKIDELKKDKANKMKEIEKNLTKKNKQIEFRTNLNKDPEYQKLLSEIKDLEDTYSLLQKLIKTLTLNPENIATYIVNQKFEQLSKNDFIKWAENQTKSEKISAEQLQAGRAKLKKTSKLTPQEQVQTPQEQVQTPQEQVQTPQEQVQT